MLSVWRLLVLVSSVAVADAAADKKKLPLILPNVLEEPADALVFL